MKRILAIILALSLCLIISLTYLHDRKSKSAPMLFFPRFSKAACTWMFFSDPSNSTLLERRNGCWKVVLEHPETAPPSELLKMPGGDYPADTSVVNKALSIIATMQRNDLISQNPGNQAQFQVDSAQALYFECRDSAGTVLAAGFAGKSTTIYESNYARAQGSSDVYSVSGGVRFALLAQKERWKNKLIENFNPALVTALKISGAKRETIQLAKTGTAGPDSSKHACWEILAPRTMKADTKKVEFLLEKMSHFRTVEWEGNSSFTDSSMGFLNPFLVLAATLTDGSSRTLIVGGNKVAMKWVRNPDIPHITFTVYEYNVQDITPSLASLADTASVRN